VTICRFLRIVLYDFEFIGLLLRRVYFAIDWREIARIFPELVDIFIRLSSI
jgi:hypothetical protein